jgi:hypothetical protein
MGISVTVIFIKINYFFLFSRDIMAALDQVYFGTRNVCSDDCAMEAKDLQNSTIHNYAMYQYLPVNCDKSGHVARFPEFAYDHVNLTGRAGYGVAEGCVVDSYSALRNDPNQMTRDRCRVQLFTRIFQGGPNLSCGISNPEVEGPILQGQSSRDWAGINYPCSRTLMEIQTNQPMPMLDCVRPVQDPVHIVEPWVRGGDPTRDFVRRKQFMEQCQEHGFSRGQSARKM